MVVFTQPLGLLVYLVSLCGMQKMTYAQQLRMYEEAVMQKRLEEMTEAELQQLLQEVDADKQQLTAAKAALEKQQQQRRGQ